MLVADCPAAAAPTWSESHANMAVPVIRISATVRFCFAFCRASSMFGMRMAARMPMMATTISNSISVKPVCFPASYASYQDSPQ